MPDIRPIHWPGAPADAPALELLTPALRLVAITHSGPRIAHLSRNGGDNLLYWAPGKHARGGWDPLGGHRLWTTRPGADESEETYRPDNEPCAVNLGPDGFTVIAPIDPVTRLQRGFHVRSPADDRVIVEHFARNAGDMLWSGGLWCVTVTLPSTQTRYSAPLGDGSPWDTATLVLFSRWGGSHGTGSYADSQFTLTHDSLLLIPEQRENKRMLEARPGILAMHDPGRDILFAKHAPYVATGSYPHGANLALYTGAADNFYVELETMSPLVTLRPGESIRHAEMWLLRPAGPGLPPAADLRALFDDHA